MEIRIAEPIREQLRLSFVEEGDFLAALARERPEPVAGTPGAWRCRPTLAVPRPLDPETAEMRQLEVTLRRDGERLEVTALRGLDLEGLGG